MRLFVLALAGLLAVPVAAPPAVYAQGTTTEPATPKRTRTPKAARPKREPTANQLAARERQRKCAAEWKEAKAKRTTGGLKWPKYWSQCNARLKGNQA